jgi:predicted phosphodiesterase
VIAALIAHVGDVVQDNTNLKEWKTYWTGPWAEKSIGQQTPLVVARGNHDGNHPYAYSYINNPPPSSSWFAFSVSDTSTKLATSTRFIVLDSNWEKDEEVGIRMKQTLWLEKELQTTESRSAGCRVVLVHIAPFIEYWEADVYEAENKMWGDYIRADWVPLFERYNVDIVISGHSHVYQRGSKNGITYIVLGGGGGSLEKEPKVADLGVFKKTVISHHYGVFEMKDSKFQMKVFSDRDEIIDDFSIA